MDLLFKREQTMRNMARVQFTLWAKLEPNEEEQALIERYRFDHSVLIGSDDSELVGKAMRIGALIFVITTSLLSYSMSNITLGLLGGAILGTLVGWIYLNELRETIYVRDLLHGRRFKCESVVELAKKEAWLEGACGVLRQVMESAKHWDGVEHITIDPLPKQDAKDLIVRLA